MSLSHISHPPYSACLEIQNLTHCQSNINQRSKSPPPPSVPIPSPPPAPQRLTCAEDLAAAVAARGELGVIAGAAVDVLRLGAELLVHQRHPALVAQEACLVPVLVLVAQVLRDRQRCQGG